MPGFSSHADKNMLLSWLKNTNCKKVFVNHGEDTICDDFAELCEKTFGYSASAPFSGDIFDLKTGKYEYLASAKRLVTKNKEAGKRARLIYDRLLAAGNRLLKVIEHNKGGTNKDLSKFTDQINHLCEKYERK